MRDDAGCCGMQDVAGCCGMLWDAGCCGANGAVPRGMLWGLQNAVVSMVPGDAGCCGVPTAGGCGVLGTRGALGLGLLGDMRVPGGHGASHPLPIPLQRGQSCSHPHPARVLSTPRSTNPGGVDQATCHHRRDSGSTWVRVGTHVPAPAARGLPGLQQGPPLATPGPRRGTELISMLELMRLPVR